MDISKIITDAHTGLDFGTVAFFVKKHEGEVTTVDTQKMTTHKVKDNAEGLAIPISVFKAMQASSGSGNVTFTVTFNNGAANKVMVQDIKHHTNKNWS